MKRLHLIVSGKVQGVFYRDFVRREAEKLGIKGFVRNLSDGTVEVVAEGDETILKKLVAACRKGPLMAFVKSVDVKDEPSTGQFEDFDVRYS